MALAEILEHHETIDEHEEAERDLDEVRNRHENFGEA